MNLETEITQPLWQAIRRSYESQAWSNAILDASYYLSDAIRSRTGLQSDGTALAGQALGAKNPKLRLNRLETESEKNIQAGVEQLLRGFYQAIRNPRSHERIADTQPDADSLIVFVDHLLRLLGHARAAFSIDECVNRIVERNFVPTKRYAELLVAEIPPRQCLQVALEVFRRKSETEGANLRYFFDATVNTLSAHDADALFGAMSSELRDCTDDSALRSLLQLLNPDYWPRLDEVARLRTENRLVQNAAEGSYISATDKCVAGSLATWSRGAWPHFSLKNELFRALLRKLFSGSVESEDYVLKYLFRDLDSLAPAPGQVLDQIFADRLAAGDRRFKDALAVWRAPRSWTWSENVTKALEAFQAAEIVPGDDEVPF